MAEAEPEAKPIVDVAHPGKSAPATTSKPVIITNRPIMKDPMVVDKPDDAQASESRTTAQPLSKGKEATIRPLDSSPTTTPDATPEAPSTTPAEQSTQTEAAGPAKATKTDSSSAETASETASDKSEAAVEQNEAAEAAKQAEHAEAIQKLVDSKQYVLPINAVEKRKTKRFVLLGVLMSVLLAVAWVDVALDAGLVNVSGVPHTHLFSVASPATTAGPTASAPAATPVKQKYTSPVDGLTFRYPANWVVASNSSTTIANGGDQKLEVTVQISKGDTTKTVVSLSRRPPQPGVTAHINFVKYRPVVVGGKHLYVRQLVYEYSRVTDSNVGTLFTPVSSLSESKGAEKTGDSISTQETSLAAKNGSPLIFDVFSGGNKVNSDGYSTANAARAYFTTSTYHDAEAILLSLKI